MIWILWSLATVPVGGSLALHLDGRAGYELTPREAKLVLLANEIMLVVLLVLFVGGFPQPGDMREIDNSLGWRLIIFGLIGVNLGVDFVHSPSFPDVHRRKKNGEMSAEPDRASMLSSLASQVYVALLTVTAVVRGFADSAIGVEYHWWLFALACSQAWWLLFYRSYPSRDNRVWVFGLVNLFLAVAGFLVQPLGFAPN